MQELNCHSPLNLQSAGGGKGEKDLMAWAVRPQFQHEISAA